MVKRALLVFTLVVAGLGVGSKAMAWHDCGGPRYVASYPTYGTYAAVPYGSAWGPRAAYYAPVAPYPVYYGRGYDRHHHHRDYGNYRGNGVTVSFGF